VAGFIGSPAMSFIDAHASEENGGIRLRGGDRLDLYLPGAAAVGGDVVVGIRPEAARLWDDEHEGLAGPVAGTVAYVEALGRETFVGVEVAGSRITVHQPGRSGLSPGDRVSFGVLPKAVAFSDRESGVALTTAQLVAR
jgi:multiple sugar transport system ATP-binding protein